MTMEAESPGMNGSRSPADLVSGAALGEGSSCSDVVAMSAPTTSAEAEQREQWSSSQDPDVWRPALNTVNEMLREWAGRRRETTCAKLFEVDMRSGKWQERGTGAAMIVKDHESGFRIALAPWENLTFPNPNLLDLSPLQLQVFLFHTPVLSNTHYALQEKVLVTWRTKDARQCLSFVDEAACMDFWLMLQLIAPDRVASEGEEEEDDEGDNGADEEEDEEEEEESEEEEDEEEEKNVEERGQARILGIPGRQRAVAVCIIKLFSEDTAAEHPELTSEETLREDGQSRAMSSALVGDDDDDPLDGMEEQFKSRGVLPGGLSSLLEDYEDSVLQNTLDPNGGSNSGHNSGLGISELAPPHTAEALANALAYLQCIEGNIAGLGVDVGRILTHITEPNWLFALWGLLHTAIKTEDAVVCSSIAELLCRIVSVYSLSSNPFVSLALTPDGARFLDYRDPLVQLLSDVHYVNFFRAMEYESELRKHSLTVDHVGFLENTSQFKEVICKGDEGFRITCHFIYRVMYLRDVCLPRHLDEPTIQRLTGVINAGHAYLCRIIQTTPNSMGQLREMIVYDVGAARFLLQLLSVLRSNLMASHEKPQIFDSIKAENVLEALEGYLTGDCPAAKQWEKQAQQWRLRQRIAEERMTAAIESDVERRHRPHLLSHDRLTFPSLSEIALEILHLTVEYNPGILRFAFLRQAAAHPEGRPTFWYALCRTFTKTDNEGLLIQLSDIFRKVLDPATMESPMRDEFLSLFYDKGVLDQLTEMLFTPIPTGGGDLATSVVSKATGTCYIPYFTPNLESNEPLASETTAAEDRQLKVLSRNPGVATSEVALVSGDNSLPSQQRDSSSKLSLAEGSGEHLLTFETSAVGATKRRAVAELPESTKPVARRVNFHAELHTGPHNSNADSGRMSSHLAANPADAAPALKNLTKGLGTAECGDGTLPSIANESYQHSDDAKVGCASNIDSPLVSKILRNVRRRLEEATPEKVEEMLFAAQSQLSFVKCQISEILAFCVLKHSARIQYRNYQQNIHLRLLQMAQEPIFDPFAATHAVKFLKACLAAEPGHYVRTFIRHDIFRPLLSLLMAQLSKTAPRGRGEGSLLESAILDFFSFISSSVESSVFIASLNRALFERHGQTCAQLSRFYTDICQYDIFEQLRARYDAMQFTATRRQSLLNEALLAGDTTANKHLKSGAGLQTGPAALSKDKQRAARLQLASFYYCYVDEPINRNEDDVEREIQESYFEADDGDESKDNPMEASAPSRCGIGTGGSRDESATERKGLHDVFSNNTEYGGGSWGATAHDAGEIDCKNTTASGEAKNCKPQSFSSFWESVDRANSSLLSGPSYSNEDEDDSDVPEFLRSRMPDMTTTSNPLNDVRQSDVSFSHPKESSWRSSPSLPAAGSNPTKKQQPLIGLKLCLAEKTSGTNQASSPVVEAESTDPEIVARDTN